MTFPSFFYEGKLKEVNYTYRADEVVNVKAVVYDIVDDNRIIIKKKGNDLYDYIALSKDQTKDLEIGKEYSFQLKVYRNTTSNNLTEIFQISRVLRIN